MLCSSIECVVEELYRVFHSDVLPRLAQIADEGRRYLYFLAWLNRELIDRGLGRIILTGGFAVEVYTGRVYRTMDVDIIVEGTGAREAIELFLKRFSESIGRGYLPKYELLQLKSIDIVSTVYTKPAQPTKIVVGELYLYVETVEELIVTYLAGWKFWGATEDRDKALWLYTVWKDRIDLGYLEERAREESVYGYLEELRKMVAQSI
ncbi:MAG: hypothetical protein QXJ56_05065 [Ignisphaera sp.]|uniref:Nucleotidyl transferase AbiEii/AbiGii toxin family protein n=2 Tax=Ignisphaera aggregans TaxID=334771 RepID=A0A7J3I8I6_9CREN